MKTCDAKDLLANSDGWENATLERYLEAMRAWLKATVRIEKPAPSWDLIIRMLEAAKIYE